MNELSKVFNYNGNSITMRVKNGIAQVNLTEVAKSFPDKNLTHIVNSQEINDYIETFSKLQNCSLADLLEVTRGGNNPGTWAHQRVALRVAQKLSTEFAIWVDIKLEELLISGSTAITPNFSNPAEAARAWADAYEAQQRAIAEKTKAEALALEAKQAEEQERREKEIALGTIEEQRPDVEFSKNYIDANGETVMEVAKRLEDFGYFIAAKKCYEFLNELEFLFKRGRYWCIYETARKNKYVKYGKTNNNEEYYSCKTPKITNTGFKRILDIIKAKPEIFLKYGEFNNKNN